MIKRVNIKGSNGLYYSNMILIENIDDLLEYQKNIGDNRHSLAAAKICEKIQKRIVGHTDDDLANAVEGQANSLGCGSIWLLGDMAVKSNMAKLKYVNRGNVIAINHNGGWMPISENDIIEPVTLNYTLDDIKITKFEGGKHYYAKIRDIEVIDKYGDRKWNTREYAHKIAVETLNKLNETQKK